MSNRNLYIDKIHGIEVKAYNETKAYEMINDECFDRKIKEPEKEDIVEVYYEFALGKHWYKFQPKGSEIIIVGDPDKEAAKKELLILITQ